MKLVNWDCYILLLDWLIEIAMSQFTVSYVYSEISHFNCGHPNLLIYLCRNSCYCINLSYFMATSLHGKSCLG